MKNKSILILGALAVCLLFGCVKELQKEGVYDKTTLKGRAVAEIGNGPLAHVKVQVTNGTAVVVQTNTNSNGEFSLDVDYSTIDPSCYLFMEQKTETSVVTKRLVLKGVGKAEYNYGEIFFGQSVPNVVTNPVTNVNANSAVCGGNIISDGGSAVTRRGICWSTSNDPQIDSSPTAYDDNGGSGSYSCTMTGLSAGTTYYVRAFAQNSEGLSYGEVRTFTTTQSESWLAYGGITSVTHWGLTNGGLDEWAVMFPVNMLSEYAGWYITKVRVNVDVKDKYILRIYEGGTTSPNTLKKTGTYDIQNTGWRNLLVEPGYPINASTTLWISLSLEYEAGVYPKGAVAGVNNPNARWSRVNNGQWHDNFNNNGGEDICWAIRAYVTDAAKGEERVLEFEVPVNSLPGEDVPSVAPLEWWDVPVATPSAPTIQTENSDRRKP